MGYYYNPLDEACKNITGGIPRMSELTLRIIERESGEGNFSAQTCTLVLCKDGESEQRLTMKPQNGGFEITLRFYQSGLYFYRFEIDGRGFFCGRMRKGEFSDSNRYWQITVFEPYYKTPDWFKGGIMYQIFPDRFHKVGDIPAAEHKILRSDWGGTPRYQPNEYGKVLNNDFFGGNLNGVREKLPYLKELGVTTIYFNPIFEAYSNHRYDTGDYMKIDPLLGTEEDFDRLIEEAKKCGIGIILDGVFNHTGDDSRYFNRYGRYPEVGAYQATHSPYSDWYNFYEFPEGYDSWWGIATLPAVNENSESYQNFILGKNGVLKNWLNHGIMGWRLDVADEIPDFFLSMLRTSVKEENTDAVIIGEVWEDASNKVAYSVRRKYLQGNELDSVMNYPLKDAIINFVQTKNTTMLRETVFQLIDNYPKQTLDSLMNILGTHDTPRILTVLGNQCCETKEEMEIARLSDEVKSAAKEKLKMASFLQYTLPGVPCVYYGDENGMEGDRDPFCRRCYDWENPDEELRAHYRKLGKIRGNDLKDIFSEGVYKEIFSDSSCIVFERRSNSDCAYVFVNNSGRKYNMTFQGKFKEFLTGKSFCDKLEVQPYSYGILLRIK
ncbi:MAG: glycoside hydrolase family 13 protein [Clostridia bacterium]|nr:glycoside hydrolase family 13 protein [Clostridia bacterium]